MNTIHVKKRNGGEVPFCITKIKDSIHAAGEAAGVGLSDEQIEEIISKIKFWDKMSVEDIQDGVCRTLFAEPGLYEVGKNFLLYREEHKHARFIRERIDYMDSYVTSGVNASTSSETDPNSNVSMKNVANLEGEVYKAENRLIQRCRMKDKLEELFPGQGLGKKYVQLLNNHVCYAHDESNSPVSKYYCNAVTTYPLLSEGVGNVDGITPSAPNDIWSFSGQITNLVFLLSSQCKGAVALGDYFIALNYYVVQDFGENWYKELDKVISAPDCKRQNTVRSVIRKGMKHFIYGINQPAGNRSYNSPYSIFVA